RLFRSGADVWRVSCRRSMGYIGPGPDRARDDDGVCRRDARVGATGSDHAQGTVRRFRPDSCRHHADRRRGRPVGLYRIEEDKMTSGVNRQWVLAERPDGAIDEHTFALRQSPIPEPAESQALVRVVWLGIDATQRTWLNDDRTYISPV